MAQLWLRGAAYITYNAESNKEHHGVAVYASEADCWHREEQPMFIIPLNCASADDIVRTWYVLRLGTIPVPLTAERNPETYGELTERMIEDTTARDDDMGNAP